MPRSLYVYFFVSFVVQPIQLTTIEFIHFSLFIIFFFFVSLWVVLLASFHISVEPTFFLYIFYFVCCCIFFFYFVVNKFQMHFYFNFSYFFFTFVFVTCFKPSSRKKKEKKYCRNMRQNNRTHTQRYTEAISNGHNISIYPVCEQSLVSYINSTEWNKSNTILKWVEEMKESKENARNWNNKKIEAIIEMHVNNNLLKVVILSPIIKLSAHFPLTIEKLTMNKREWKWLCFLCCKWYEYAFLFYSYQLSVNL